jgi:hypothetical protein
MERWKKSVLRSPLIVQRFLPFGYDTLPLYSVGVGVADGVVVEGRDSVVTGGAFDQQGFALQWSGVDL